MADARKTRKAAQSRDAWLPTRRSRGDRQLPLVAVVGRPNVGKSTLVNRLAARRASIVSPQEGVTRDVLARPVAWRGREFRVLDTGGLIGERSGGPPRIATEVAQRALIAARGADLVIFVIDNETGLMPDDFALAERLKRMKVPVILASNKVDDASAEPQAAEAWSLGLGEPVCVSALHGRGSGDLLDRIVDLLPEFPAEDGEVAETETAIAIVGRPNVGKSSVFNRLVGEERAIVHHEPGTTRDSIDTFVEINGKGYRFVDTAGLRRRSKAKGVESYGAGRTREAISRSDVALIVLDASQGATSQDQRIAESVAEAGVGAVIVANKWDLIEGREGADDVMRSITDKLAFISYAPLVRTSATTGRGISQLAQQIDKVMQTRGRQIPTPKLNALIHEWQNKTPPPSSRGKSPRVLYATQSGTAPPAFMLFATGRLSPEWLRFIEHRLRDEFDLTGNPLRIIVRRRTRRS